MADDGGAVPETSGTNNTRAVLIRLSPDLIVSALTVPATAAAGATIQVSDTTRNQGSGSAIATTTKYYLSMNATFDSATDVYLGSRGVPILLTGVSNVGPQTDDVDSARHRRGQLLHHCGRRCRPRGPRTERSEQRNGEADRDYGTLNTCCWDLGLV